MKPQVKLIEGYHITAAEKRGILECIEFLRGQGKLDHPLPILGAPGSSKRYTIAPHKMGDNVYQVIIRTTERNDWGHLQERTSRNVVEIRGVSPLPWDRLFGIAQEQLSPKSELTAAGEQFVIPGCERNASPKAVQLGLFS